MDVKSQARGDGNCACPICGKVFSSLKAVHGHRRIHKTEPKSVTTKVENRRQRALKRTIAAMMWVPKEDLSPDELEVAEGILRLRYGFDTPVGVCSSSSATDSSDPLISVDQENQKTEGNANVDQQTVAVPKQEEDCLETSITVGNINNDGNSSGCSGDGDGSRAFQCPRCPKTFPTQQALGGHMAGHNNMERKAAAVAEGGKSSAAQVNREHKCEICRTIFSSGQALGGQMRKHLLEKEKVVVNVDNHKPVTNQDDNDQKDVIMVDDNTVATNVNIPVQVQEDIFIAVNVDVSVITEDDHESSDHQRLGGLMLDLNEEPVEIDED